jgi:hypothetical protein
MADRPLVLQHRSKGAPTLDWFHPNRFSKLEISDVGGGYFPLSSAPPSAGCTALLTRVFSGLLSASPSGTGGIASSLLLVDASLDCDIFQNNSFFPAGKLFFY